MRSKAKTRLYVVVTALLIVVASAVIYAWWQARLNAQVNLARSLVGRWATEERSDGLIAGAAPVLDGGIKHVQSNRGVAWSFDGLTASASVAHGPGLVFGAGQDFSVMAWIQPQRANTAFNVMSIVEKRKVGGITTARGFSLHLDDGRLACQISPGSGLQITRSDLLSPTRWPVIWKNRNALPGYHSFVSPGPDLRDGRIHHVALTLARHSTTGGKLYVDGSLVHTFDPSKLRGSLANKEPLLIGTHPDTTLQCGFKGTIEDVRLYSRALSPAEIEQAAQP